MWDDYADTCISIDTCRMDVLDQYGTTLKGLAGNLPHVNFAPESFTFIDSSICKFI